MQKIKKFNQFLLENYPILWYTKFPHIVIVACLTGLLSFVWGYTFSGLEALKSKEFEYFLFESLFLQFEIIVMLMIAIVWAIFFFKNNAFKNFYPVSKLYLFNVFLLIFGGFSIILLSFGLFQTGAGLRVSQFYKKNNFDKDVITLTQASQFIPTYDTKYGIEKHPYFVKNRLELTRVLFDKDLEEEYINTSLYIKPDNSFSKYYSDETLDKYVISPADYTFIDGQKYIIFKSSDVYYSADSCDYFKVLDKIVHPINLSENALINFTFYKDDYSFKSYRYYDANKYKRIVFPIEQMNAENKALITSENYTGITQQIENFTGVLDKYAIKQFIEPHLLLTYFKLKDMKGIKSVVSTNFNYADNRLKYMENHKKSLFFYLEQLNNTKSGVKVEDEKKFFEAMRTVQFYNYDENAWDNLVHNYNSYNYYNVYTFWVSIFVAMGLAYLFLLFVIVDFVSVLIAIPTVGVISMIASLIAIPIFAYGNNSSDGSGYLAYILFVELIIFSVVVLLIVQNAGVRRIQNIALVVGYKLAPLLVVTLVGLITALSSSVTDRYDKCGNYKYDDNVQFFNPWLVACYLLIAIFSYLFLVRKSKSNPE